MITIHYPPPSFNIKEEKGKEMIFDALRKKWVVLTPEEWVRQNFIAYMIQEKKYPVALIGVEKEIIVGELKKRFDILVYDNNHQPWMMVECKSMEVSLAENVLEQLLRYHSSIRVSYLVITNGNECMAWEKNDGKLVEINELPALL